MPCALLSWFDGVAAARWALQEAGVKPTVFLAWETDPEAAKLAAHRVPDVLARGAFEADTAKGIVRVLEDNQLPHHARVLGTAGPPCPDLSNTNGDGALGRAGVEGITVDEVFDIFLRFRELSPWRVDFLIENVVPMVRGDADHFSKRLGVEAVLVDAADWGRVRRPRLWWTSLVVPPQLAVKGVQDGFVK